MKALLVIAFLWNGFPTVEYVYVPDMAECRSLGWGNVRVEPRLGGRTYTRKLVMR